MRYIAAAVVLGILSLGFLDLSTATADSARADLAISVSDRLGELFLNGTELRERHYTTVVVENVGSAHAAVFSLDLDVDPADHCHDGLPNALISGDLWGNFNDLPAGGSKRVDFVWSIVVTPIEMELQGWTRLLDAPEVSLDNNEQVLPLRTHMPATIRGDETLCDKAVEAIEAVDP